MITDHVADTPEALAAQLATRIENLLSAAIREKGEASLVVSGGRTPKRLFQLLSSRPIDWAKVRVTLADERLVPAFHADLNARLVRECLLTQAAGAAQFFPLWDGAGDPRAVAEAALSHFIARPDAVLLGMGEDGHTASLFPGAPGLEDALDPDNPAPLLYLEATPTRQPRVSLTLSRLLASRHILLAFEGMAKRAVYERALAEGPATELPVRAILRQTRVPVEIHWSRS